MLESKREFEIEDLVQKEVTLATKNHLEGKLGSNCEGPYRVTTYKWKGTYHLEIR